MRVGDREVVLRVAAKRLPKSLTRESRLSVGASRREEAILFLMSSVASCYKCRFRTNEFHKLG